MKKRTNLKGVKNEKSDEENVTGGIGAGNCFWVIDNGIRLQERRAKERNT
jgi:hypothetical protein